jgi:type VI secretion system protein
MPIVLNLETSDPALGESAARRIEVTSRLTIGRGPDNDLVLPDPQRYLSKTHCVIAFDARGGTVTDTSTNGVFLDGNAERLQRNVPTPLAEGSVLRFGGYQLSVAAIAPALPATAPGPASASVAPTPNSAQSADDGLFGDPLAAPPVSQDPYPNAYPGPGADRADFEPQRAHDSFAPVIPDDADFLADRPPQQWEGASQADHVPSAEVFFTPPKVVDQRIPDDWDLSDSGPSETPRAPERRRLLEAESLPPEAPPPLRAPAALPARASAGDTTAVASFLAAAGIKGIALSDAEKASVMQLAGEILATMTRGLAEILAARASTKQEFRIERTVIGAARNNPLKFSETPDEAMRVLLLGSTPGFMPAREAVEEALDDIKSHQLAVLAGMQMALARVVSRFDPDKLEKRLEQRSLIEGIVPAARKARYWELFRTVYKEIATELEEDFQKAFGAEFARAYRKRVDQQ